MAISTSLCAVADVTVVMSMRHVTRAPAPACLAVLMAGRASIVKQVATPVLVACESLALAEYVLCSLLNNTEFITLLIDKHTDNKILLQ